MYKAPHYTFSPESPSFRNRLGSVTRFPLKVGYTHTKQEIKLVLCAHCCRALIWFNCVGIHRRGPLQCNVHVFCKCELGDSTFFTVFHMCLQTGICSFKPIPQHPLFGIIIRRMLSIPNEMTRNMKLWSSTEQFLCVSVTQTVWLPSTHATRNAWQHGWSIHWTTHN